VQYTFSSYEDLNLALHTGKSDSYHSTNGPQYDEDVSWIGLYKQPSEDQAWGN
jgi:hypothetical protein